MHLLWCTLERPIGSGRCHRVRIPLCYLCICAQSIHPGWEGTDSPTFCPFTEPPQHTYTYLTHNILLSATYRRCHRVHVMPSYLLSLRTKPPSTNTSGTTPTHLFSSKQGSLKLTDHHETSRYFSVLVRSYGREEVPGIGQTIGTCK